VFAYFVISILCNTWCTYVVYLLGNKWWWRW